MRRSRRTGVARQAGLGLQMFTSADLIDIHLTTLEILERTGVFVEDPAALAVFRDAKCSVDAETQIVRIPPYLVEEAIQSAPSTVTLYGRQPDDDVVLQDGRVGFTNFGEAIQVVDAYTGELREPTKRDVGDMARVCDALEEIDIHERPAGSHDVPPMLAPLHNADAMLHNTSKPILIGPISGYLAGCIAEMGAASVGGADTFQRRPNIIYGTCPVSPLKLVQDTCEIIMEGARRGICVLILSMAMAGGSAPIGLAGSLVTHNVEVLAGLTLSQLTERGAPVVYSSSSTAMDLRLGACTVGTPECALMSAGVAQLARHYMLPSFVAGA